METRDLTQPHLHVFTAEFVQSGHKSEKQTFLLQLIQFLSVPLVWLVGRLNLYLESHVRQWHGVYRIMQAGRI
jgi:hypothetical protein